MYTQNLAQYLASVPRMPYISNETTIRYAFERNKLILSDELLDFQLRYAGYHHCFNAESFIYGLLHEESAYLPVFDIDYDDNNPDNILFTCMDCEPSNARSLNSQGVFYKDYLPIASSFTKYMEQRAFSWKMSQEKRWMPINLPNHVQQAIWEEQSGKLEEFFAKEVSDEYAQMYVLEDLVIKTMQEQILAWKVVDTQPKLFYFSL